MLECDNKPHNREGGHTAAREAAQPQGRHLLNRQQGNANQAANCLIAWTISSSLLRATLPYCTCCGGIRVTAFASHPPTPTCIAQLSYTDSSCACGRMCPCYVRVSASALWSGRAYPPTFPASHEHVCEPCRVECRSWHLLAHTRLYCVCA